jgi:hypothetical protein
MGDAAAELEGNAVLLTVGIAAPRPAEPAADKAGEEAADTVRGDEVVAEGLDVVAVFLAAAMAAATACSVASDCCVVVVPDEAGEDAPA